MPGVSWRTHVPKRNIMQDRRGTDADFARAPCARSAPEMRANETGHSLTPLRALLHLTRSKLAKATPLARNGCSSGAAGNNDAKRKFDKHRRDPVQLPGKGQRTS